VDVNAAIRSIPLRTVFLALGIDLSGFKERKGKNGREWYGNCFYHQAKNNNTSLSFTDELAHCFSCSVKFRGAIDAVKEYRKCGFQEAVEFLRTLNTTPPAESPRINDSAASQGRSVDLTKYRKSAKPCDWLDKRVDKAMQERYEVFYYQNDSRKSTVNGHVLIPVKELDGTLRGYLARNIGEVTAERPKYKFPPGLAKSSFLFGAHELGTFGQLPLRVVYLLESPFGVMRFASLGLPAVAAYGWSVSAEQLAILAALSKGCIFLPDKNKYHDTGNLLPLIAAKMWVRFPPLPDGVDDPEQLSRTQVLAL
jgi:DNA primase